MSKNNTPPAVVEFEASILSSALMFPNDVLDIVEGLQAHHFYNLAYGKIFGIISELSAKGVSPDAAAVFQVASERGLIEEIGGATAVSKLLDNPPCTDIDFYISKIKEKYALRKTIEISNAIMKRCYRDGGDAQETIDAFQQEIFDIGYGMQRESLSSMADLTREGSDRYEMLYNSGGGITGIPTGFYQWDQLLCGLQRSDLVILAARPSMGKTSLALQVSVNVAGDGIPVGIFSLEMSKAQLRDKAVAFDSKVNTNKFRQGNFKRDEFERVQASLDRLYSYPLYIDDTAALHWMEIKRRARKMKVKYGIELIIIDHLQLVHTDRNENRNIDLGVITAGFKAMAKDLDIPVIVLSQLNREVEKRVDKRPQLADLRESGNIEQDADVCSFLYRPGYYGLEEEVLNQAEIMTLKQRNGPTGLTVVQFDPPTASFRNLTFDHKDPGRGWGS